MRPDLPEGTAAAAAAHRSRLSAALPGRTIVLAAGTAPVRNDDASYGFRADSSFVWLTGCPVEDAVLAADLGCDGVVLSNHGGRQVDRGNVPLEILPRVVDAVQGRIEDYVDGGIMHGSDIVAAVGFGAHGALIGRAYLYGLMAGGLDGVRRVIAILRKEIQTTMQLIGARSIDEIRSIDVRLRP